MGSFSITYETKNKLIKEIEPGRKVKILFPSGSTYIGEYKDYGRFHLGGNQYIDIYLSIAIDTLKVIINSSNELKHKFKDVDFDSLKLITVENPEVFENLFKEDGKDTLIDNTIYSMIKSIYKELKLGGLNFIRSDILFMSDINKQLKNNKSSILDNKLVKNILINKFLRLIDEDNINYRDLYTLGVSVVCNEDYTVYFDTNKYVACNVKSPNYNQVFKSVIAPNQGYNKPRYKFEFNELDAFKEAIRIELPQILSKQETRDKSEESLRKLYTKYNDLNYNLHLFRYIDSVDIKSIENVFIKYKKDEAFNNLKKDLEDYIKYYNHDSFKVIRDWNFIDSLNLNDEAFNDKLFTTNDYIVPINNMLKEY